MLPWPCSFQDFCGISSRPPEVAKQGAGLCGLGIGGWGAGTRAPLPEEPELISYPRRDTRKPQSAPHPRLETWRDRKGPLGHQGLGDGDETGLNRVAPW